jgi:hypothetical protein
MSLRAQARGASGSGLESLGRNESKSSSLISHMYPEPSRILCVSW